MSAQVAVLGIVISLISVSAQARQREDIQVKGQWVLEVVNKDGSVAQRQAFQNALLEPRVLGGLMTGHMRIQHFGLALGVADPVSGAPTGHLVIVPQNVEPIPGTSASNLTVTPLFDLSTFTLAGSHTDSAPRKIISVQTRVRLCFRSSLEMDFSCTPLMFLPFTGTTLAEAGLTSPLVLEPEQTIRVQVTISFGSAPHGTPQ